MGEVLDMGPTWSLPQQEIKGSYESHVLPEGTPLPPLSLIFPPGPAASFVGPTTE